MKNKQATYWKIDALLFTGFVVAFWLDLTGLWFHQWLGLFIGIFALVHMFMHWKWVKTTFSAHVLKPSNRSHWYVLLDGGLLFGLIGIVFTGIIMSTWLQVNLNNYSTWLTVHIVVSITTLAILVIKLAAHGKWIVAVSRKVFSASQSRQILVKNSLQPVFVKQEAYDRRAFLRMMGIVGAASVFALTRAADGLSFVEAESIESVESEKDAVDRTSATQSLQPATGTTAESTPTQGVVTTTSITEEPIAVSTQVIPTQSSCVIRCQKGCSYPGRCHRYTDSNANGYCDNGECL